MYWDMNIPTEYYEEEFIEFENYMEFTLKNKPCTIEEPYTNGDFYLKEFQNYENYRDMESKKIRKEIKRKPQAMKTKLKKSQKAAAKKKENIAKKQAKKIKEPLVIQEDNVSVM